MTILKEKLKRLLKYKCLLAFFAGNLFSLPFFDSRLFIFTYAGIALLIVSLYDRENYLIKKAFRKGMLFGIGFFIPLYHWFIALYPFEGFNFTPAQGIFIIIAACIGISIFHSLFYATSIYIFSKLRINRCFAPVVLAAFWATTEWIMALGDLGFSWGRVAISQIFMLPAVQTVSLFGSYFITLIVVASAGYIGMALISIEKKKLLFALSALIFGINFVIGTVIFLIPEKAENEINVAVLQGNITSSEKWDNEGRTSKEAYYELLNNVIQDDEIDMVVFPESAIPLYYTKNSEVREYLQEIATENDIIIILGALTTDDEYNYNSLVAIYPDGGDSVVYNKRHLAPFGEFLPYRSFFETVFPFVKNFNLADDEFAFGKGSSLVDSEYGKLGGLICFDSIFEPLARESTYDGAEILILATNDSWYKDTAGVRQHADFAKLRAIENGRYMVRAANTGVSMLINTKGQVLILLPALQKGFVSGNVYTSSKITLYTEYGDTALHLSNIIIIISILFSIYKSIKNKKENNNGM
ncbi:MAG: apolipoprotein N-acyltransferase [Clostridiales bacterium GWF2_38_85]|nr:MAG: apolipoprotein N-acyltransferase [Clostridiales bacterium GWF2_38_85]HBL83669.1 apolipoprotein N-acyltransferase [Clostridiales bacterium]